MATKNDLSRWGNSARSLTVPSELLEFLKDREAPISDSESAYREFLASTDLSPTYNEFVLYLNIVNLQSIADTLKRSMDSINERLSDADSRERSDLLSRQDSLMKKYHEVTSTLLKYANAGVDRDTPKQSNITVQHLDLNSIHQRLKDVSESSTIDVSGGGDASDER